MFAVIPTFTVSIERLGCDNDVWRVPEPQLEAFIHVLLFNKSRAFTVYPDDLPEAQAFTQQVTG